MRVVRFYVSYFSFSAFSFSSASCQLLMAVVPTASSRRQRSHPGLNRHCWSFGGMVLVLLLILVVLLNRNHSQQGCGTAQHATTFTTLCHEEVPLRILLFASFTFLYVCFLNFADLCWRSYCPDCFLHFADLRSAIAEWYYESYFLDWMSPLTFRISWTLLGCFDFAWVAMDLAGTLADRMSECIFR